MEIKVSSIEKLIDVLLKDYDNELILSFSKKLDKNGILNILLNKDIKKPEEIFLLGLIYSDGLGTEVDYTKALNYFMESLDLGVIKSAQEIASIYGEGRGVEKDIDKAKEYFDVAANAGYAFSFYNLGIIYMNGLGSTNMDRAKGLECFKKAADIGFRRAMEMVGKCYFSGLGVERDEEEAEKWFAMAYGDDWYFK